MKPECSQTVQERSLRVCDRVGKKIKVYSPAKDSWNDRKFGVLNWIWLFCWYLEPQVTCKHCQFELGGQLPFGPNGTNIIAFGTEKVPGGRFKLEKNPIQCPMLQVRLLGHSLTKRDKWWSEKDKGRVRAQFCKWNMLNFVFLFSSSPLSWKGAPRTFSRVNWLRRKMSTCSNPRL